MLIFRIHIRASSDVLFDLFDVSFFGSFKQRTFRCRRPTTHNQHGCDCCE